MSGKQECLDRLVKEFYEKAEGWPYDQPDSLDITDDIHRIWIDNPDYTSEEVRDAVIGFWRERGASYG